MVVIAISNNKDGYPGLYFIDDNRNTYIISGCKLPLGLWEHLAVTYSNSYGKIYVGGKLCVSGQLDKALIPNNLKRNLNLIGKSGFSVDVLANAEYDELKIYKRALSAEEISIEYGYRALKL